MDVPFVLTVSIEENAFDFFNALRKIYFPQGSAIDSNLTLFQLLPNEPAVIDTVETISKQFHTLLMQVNKPSFTGSGVAYKIECRELEQLHQNLQQQWGAFLIPQDKEKLQPHITIQDQVSEGEAQELLQFLNENFGAFAVQGTGLQLWEYHNGQSRLFRQFDFLRS
jgi:hypothetical protein